MLTMTNTIKYLALFAFILMFTAVTNAATYVVDRNDDVTATACTAAANDCSLRGAILNANANGAGADIINFNVGGGNSQTITMSSTALPDIQTSLTIDGSTQPLWGGFPLIEINGAASNLNTNGFRITSPIAATPITVTIRALTINRFQGSGIFFNASSGITATVTDCYIGVNPGGSVDLGNGNDGIRIFAYPNSTFTIGGTATSDRNIISGNDANGINVTTALGFQNADTNVLVLNNFIGTSAGGNVDVGNTNNGISFGGPGLGYSLQVGNGLASGRNIIGGNDDSGIWANCGTVGIYNNYIGATFSGNGDVGNTDDGIELDNGVSSATIGGTSLGINIGNVISGNDRHGIGIYDASVPATIRRNLIGTNAAGTADLGNSMSGIYLSESDLYSDAAITIGSETDALDGNTISGNNNDGVEITEMMRKVHVYGNKIGTNEAGTAKIGNSLAGIRILSSFNKIGEQLEAPSSNIISGNGGSGIMLVTADSTGNDIWNNYIGTNAADANLGNTADGIYINQSANDNQIGGSPGAANRIAYNGGNGINVADGINDQISTNSIYSNTGLGIDLDGNGVTDNDTNDIDSGPNNRQNFPMIVNASTASIYGNLNSTPNAQFTIEFFRVDSCDASGNGEGKYFLASKNLTVTNNGVGIFNYFNIPLTVGQIITATATDANGNTSEFSPCRTVNPAPGTLSLSAATYSANESSVTRTIVVNRTGGSFGTVQVNYATSDGSATAGQDYTAQSGTLTFLNGEVVKTFDIPINNDTLDENDETVLIGLSFPTNGSFISAPATAVMTIIDNDAPPVISIDDVSHEEGNLGTTQFSFRVSLSTASGLPVSVDYVTTQGTATASSDYAFTSGQVNFAPGETLKNVLVTVIGDLTPELNETFTVDLSNNINATFGDNQGLGTIVDDDNPGKFSFALAPYSGTEHDSVLVTVVRTDGDAGTVSVDYLATGGTATPITDYAPTSGTLVFGDGETTKTFFVPLADDTNPEPTESVNLVLSNPIGGAILGVPSVAVLNIFDNDGGTLYTIGGEVKLANNAPVANVTMMLQGGASATTTTDANGRYSFANLAPNGNYTVTPSAIGYTFSPLSRQYNNLANDVLNASFTATAAPSRQLRIIGGNATPGQNVSVNIELVAQGDENSAGFSLNYDTAILANPQAVLGTDATTGFLTVNPLQAGKIGILVALQSGQSFTAGTKQIVTVTFNTLPTNAYSSPVTFGDSPIARQVSSTNADDLSATYLEGAVTFAQGYEADTAPRPTGNNNGTISVTDFTQVGRFVAGLDTLNPNFNEFQRADCAPRVSSGNGQITVSDYTQAGRYAAGLDPVNPAGGPNAANFAPIANGKGKEISFAVPTVVRVVNAQSSPGQQVLVTIAADAVGTENGFGFTINYDPLKLSNPLVSKGADTQSATLIPNTAIAGKVGVVLGMPFGQAIPAGTRQIVTIRFDVAANIFGGPIPLIMGDSPVFREVSDVDANVLAANFLDGTIDILGPSSANVSVGGIVVGSLGQPIPRASISLTDIAGNTRTVRTNPLGYFRFDDVAAGETYTLAVNAKGLQSVQQLISVTDEISDMQIVLQSIE